jgi:hypothetical protein
MYKTKSTKNKTVIFQYILYLFLHTIISQVLNLPEIINHSLQINKRATPMNETKGKNNSKKGKIKRKERRGGLTRLVPKVNAINISSFCRVMGDVVYKQAGVLEITCP